MADLLEVLDSLVVEGMPDRQYFGDPIAGGSLSHSGSKLLLPPSGSPAAYRYLLENPPEDKPHFSFGRAAHRMTLGAGTEIVEVKADNWRTDKAKKAQAAAELDGLTPLLSKDVRKVEDMAEALQRNALAVDLLTRPGPVEVALFARDQRDDVVLRGKVDKLPDAVGEETIVVDYKTAADADPEKFGRDAWKYRYYTQEPWYSDLVRACGWAQQVAFIFLVQCKEPPYLSYLAQVPPEAVRYGRVKNREAIGLFAACRREDQWPGPADDQVVQLGLPGWAYRDIEAAGI